MTTVFNRIDYRALSVHLPQDISHISSNLNMFEKGVKNPAKEESEDLQMEQINTPISKKTQTKLMDSCYQ